MSSNHTVFLHSPKTGLPENVFYLPFFSTYFINSTYEMGIYANKGRRLSLVLVLASSQHIYEVVP